MVLTKENVAAHAVTEHLVSLQMPDYIQDKMGRLVRYYEQNRKGSYTPLDILLSNRNQVIRQKSLLIGCGGGFQQECSQQFSPVADWMSSVDLFLGDEGQQYGNMEEAVSVARTPATCLEVWSGDHRQTPGGLKKSIAAPRRPFMSSGPMIRQSALALVIATVARAYASSSSTICSSSGRARKYFLRPPVRKPTLVLARITV